MTSRFLFWKEGRIVAPSSKLKKRRKGFGIWGVYEFSFEHTQVENDNEKPTGYFTYGQKCSTVLRDRNEDLKAFRY